MCVMWHLLCLGPQKSTKNENLAEKCLNCDHLTQYFTHYFLAQIVAFWYKKWFFLMELHFTLTTLKSIEKLRKSSSDWPWTSETS